MKMAVLPEENAFCVYDFAGKKRGAKNLDVMGFEPMTSGLEPASLTTGSNGSLFENGRS